MVAFNSALGGVTKAGLLMFALSRLQICRGDEVVFDLPSSIECTDITTKEFVAAHPNLKLIEAKLRISARIVEGDADRVVDFEYLLKTGKTMRVLQYLPATTLESAVAEDQVDIISAAEKSKALVWTCMSHQSPWLSEDTHNQTSKTSESSHYKKLAPKDIVLASGTIDREHGVFFRIRPSRTSSLEGGREFSFVAEVPKNWRGDVCSICCTARATKRSVISTTVVASGRTQATVGMYLSGDGEAATAAENLRVSQDIYNELQADRLARTTVFRPISSETNSLFAGKKAVQERETYRAAIEAVNEAQHRIAAMAK